MSQISHKEAGQSVTGVYQSADDSRPTQQSITRSPALAGRCGNPGDTVFR